jgi:hypothetical protein
MLVYLLKNYDFEIVNPKYALKPRVWTTELIPRSSTKIRFWPRVKDK